MEPIWRNDTVMMLVELGGKLFIAAIVLSGVIALGAALFR